MENSEKVNLIKLEKAYERANLYKNLLAHDMGNILTNIKASAELISMHMDNDELENLPSFIQIILEQVNRGKNLIKNIQHLTDLERLKPEIKKVNALPFIQEAIKLVEGMIPLSKKLHLTFNPNMDEYIVNANEFLIDVFHNILSNAIIHNENDVIEIKIELSQIEKNGPSYLKVEIKDNARGIEDERKELIFKTRKPSQSQKGMGLGLSLVKEVVDSYKGKIWVEDRVKGDYEKGSNFIVLLPNTK